MQVTLYMAISSDGFIATPEGDTEWISSNITDDFNQTISNAGCFVVGKRSFDQHHGELYPISEVDNYVLTHNLQLGTASSNVTYVNSPQAAIHSAQQAGYKDLILIGGGIANGLFLKDNLIKDIFLLIHPLILGSGVPLFGGQKSNQSLRLISSETFSGDIIKSHYQIDAEKNNS